MSDILTQDMAEAEFERFAKAMGLNLRMESMDADDLSAYNKQRDRLLYGLIDGSLVINQKGEAEYTPQNPESKYQETIVFHEGTGASVMQMDSYKQNQTVKKTYAVMGHMCRLPIKVFAGMAGADRKMCEAIFLFLMD
jgi:hypothetical protein